MGLIFKNLDAGQRYDGDETAFFLRELEFIKGRTFDIIYPELKARTLIPVSFEAGPGAESITYRQFSQVGIAKLIANYAQDLPRSDVLGKEFTSVIKSLGASYGWTVQEIRAAAMAGRPLNQRKANAARRSILAKENSIAFTGDTDAGLGGFLTNPNITDVALPADGVGASVLWSDKSPDQIIRDINLLARTVHSVSKGVETVDTLLLPLTQYNLIFDTPRSIHSDKSIGQWVLENSPHLKSVDWLNELEDAGAGGTDLMMEYKRSPDKLTLEIPQDYEQFPVQEKGLEFVVPVHSRIGGVLIYYPLSLAKADGL